MPGRWSPARRFFGNAAFYAGQRDQQVTLVRTRRGAINGIGHRWRCADNRLSEPQNRTIPNREEAKSSRKRLAPQASVSERPAVRCPRSLAFAGCIVSQCCLVHFPC